MQSLTHFIEYDGESSESKECEALDSLTIEPKSLDNNSGCVVWVADIKDITSDAQMQPFISRVTEAEKAKILKYKLRDDQKRALVCIA